MYNCIISFCLVFLDDRWTGGGSIKEEFQEPEAEEGKSTGREVVQLLSVGPVRAGQHPGRGLHHCRRGVPRAPSQAGCQQDHLAGGAEGCSFKYLMTYYSN